MPKCVKQPPRELLHLPVADWPEIDRVLFNKAFSRGADIFDDYGGGAHLRPRSVDAIRYAWRRWLGWIARIKPTLLSTLPGDRVTPELVKAFVTHLRETNSSLGTAVQTARLYDACRYLMPEADWTWLRALKSRLASAAQPKRKAPIPITSDRLADIGEEMMDEAEARLVREKQLEPHEKREIARLHRDGLMICFETFLYLRRTSLASMRIGTSRWRQGDVWLVDIDENDVKNRLRIRATLPSWLGERLDRHLKNFRPQFRGSSRHTGVWASEKGKELRGNSLYLAFKKSMRERAKLNLTLHDVRRIGVTTWAVEEPETASGARDLIGDKSDSVVAIHYNRAGSIRASREMAAVIRKRRV